jgi:hypothetical protein
MNGRRRRQGPLMLTKPSETFRQEIEPVFAAYLKEPLSERLANDVARVTDHHVDWLFAYYQRTDTARLNGSTNVKAFRQSLLPHCPELRMMNDLADAKHHRFLTRPNTPHRIVDTSTAAYAVQSGVLHVNGYNVPFPPAATNVVEFMRNWQD